VITVFSPDVLPGGRSAFLYSSRPALYSSSCADFFFAFGPAAKNVDH